jgi:integrase
MRAKKANVHLGRDPRWDLPETKTSRPDDVPLPPMAAAIFAEQMAASDGEYVFPANGHDTRHPYANAKSLTRQRKLILDKVGVKGVTTHDLRRTMSVTLRRLGVDNDVRARLLNHAPARIDVTNRVYTPGALWNERRQALIAWENYLRELMQHG